MKQVTKYIADDGREFESIRACLSHENDMRAILNRVNEHKNDPDEALIALMGGVQDTLGIKLSFYNGYRELFANHKPCAYACSLWRVLTDYSNDYPAVFSLYNEYMKKYIALYGEPANE